MSASTSPEIISKTKSNSKARPRISLPEGHPRDIIEQSKQDSASASEITRHKKYAAKNWNVFYKNHKNANARGNGLFFKERHWTIREFAILRKHFEEEDEPTDLIILEAGCGTGSFIYPLLEKSTHVKCYAFDFSNQAIEHVKAHELYNPSRVHAFAHDLTTPTLIGRLSEASAEFYTPSPDKPLFLAPNVVSCIFVLSALPPLAQQDAVNSLMDVLTDGGTFIFRDYALYDTTQLRFHSLPSKEYASIPSLLSPAKKEEDEDTGENGRPWYRRGDGTMCYFFTPEDIQTLVKGDDNRGFEMEGSVEVIEKLMENRKEGWSSTRRYVQGSWVKSRKPLFPAT